MTPLGWGARGGSRGDPHKSGKLGLCHGRHMPNYKIWAQAGADITISPLYSTVYSTKIGYTPTAPQGGLRGVTCKHQFGGTMGGVHTKNFRPLPITVSKRLQDMFLTWLFQQVLSKGPFIAKCRITDLWTKRGISVEKDCFKHFTTFTWPFLAASNKARQCA